MSTRARNLAITGAVVLFSGWWLVDLLFAPSSQTPIPAETSALAVPRPLPSLNEPPGLNPPSPAASAPTIGASSSTSPASGPRVSYAIFVHELQGIPPDAQPGTQLELWVAWEPPITRGPRIQRLLTDVWVEKLVPGPTPEAPVTAILSVKRSQLSDLLWADRWGFLAVAVR